ncbi:putative RNA-directed DNA polymerase from transposon X-element [Trichonephila clavipes]|nr:putative RNA-directed DNA polymerase from transposon X-element [Trichonephila clavipes]
MRGMPYVDDLQISCEGSDMRLIERQLQTTVNRLVKWCDQNGHTISPSRSSCVHFCRKRNLHPNPCIHIGNIQIPVVSAVRFLGVIFDCKLTFFPHVLYLRKNPKLPTTIKAGYLNCKIHPYIPNPLRCFKCQRFGHSQTSCRGQLTCSRCASIGHSSTDCTLEPKCVNCTQSHPSDSKLCQKWKLEKQIQEIKTNHNISYFEARRLIVPQLTQTYAQAARPSTISTATQTDPNITNIICPPLQCLTPISSKNPLPSTSSSVSTFSKSSSSTQDNLLPYPFGILPTIQISPLEIETRSHTTPAKLNSVSTENLPASVHTESNSEHSNAAEAQQFVKRKSRNKRKRPKVQKSDIEIKRVPHRSRNVTPTEITTDDEDMITYDVEEGELEHDPPNKFTIDEDPFILPKGYLRALTPSRYRNHRE